MPTSVVAICNRALSRIGAASISALTEASEQARACSVHYAACRDELLAEHPWRFASSRQTLATVDVDGPAGWDVVYARPADCLRPMALEPEAAGCGRTFWHDGPLFCASPEPVRSPPWAEWGAYILSNEPDAVLAYVARIEDPTRFPPLFAGVLTWRLAVELASVMTDDVGRMDLARRQADRLLSSALAANANAAGTPPAEADFILARS